MREVAFAGFLSVDDLESLGSTAGELVDERCIRVLAQTIEVAVVEELLEPSVDAVPTLVGEEPEELGCGDKAVGVGGSDEVEVSILECERRTVGTLGAVEARKTRGMSLFESGGDHAPGVRWSPTGGVNCTSSSVAI